jgi:hypothetical protein
MTKKNEKRNNPKSPHKKTCRWCGVKKLRQNYRKHKDICIYKHEVGFTKEELARLKGKPLPEAVKSEETKLLEVSFLELKCFLTETYNKSIHLYRKVVEKDTRTAEQKINEMLVSNSTKKLYIVEWGLYTKWLEKNQKRISQDTANEYLSKIECKASTRKKKQMMLQQLFKHLVDPSITLNKCRERISYTRKYAMKSNELQEYLEEQKGISAEFYLIQRLMSTYGLRINTIASLKIKHLVFLANDTNKTIFFPESKTKNPREEIVTDELIDLINAHLDKVRPEFDEETFVFFKQGDRKSEKERAHLLCIEVNKLITSSKVIKFNRNYKYSSHMFRKTVAYNIFNEKVGQLKEEARKAIGQSQGSQAIEFYIQD